jgi:hypothetical protein
MKINFSFFFILCSLILAGQDYQNICSPGYTFYKGSSPLINEYHYDSLGIINQDTVYYSFYTIHANPYGSQCMDTDLGPLLCRVVSKKPNGWFYFLDRNSDSIKINTQAGLNQWWNCRLFYGNRYIEAKVIDVRQDSVIDTVDQVKEIMFMVKNQDGTVFPHMINGTKVILSKHFGFTKTIEFNRFPNDTISYFLIGKTLPTRGMQGFGWRDVYNFEIDDEFHYAGLCFSNQGLGPHYESIKKILDKTIYGNNDSVEYIIEACTNVYYPPVNYDTHDTIIEKYNFISLSLNPALSYAPYEFIPNDYYEYAPEVKLQTKFNGRPVKFFWNYAFQYFENMHCWQGSYYTPQKKFEYSPGLGRTYFWWLDEGYQTWNLGYEDLVYFKKGNEEWGTPVAEDCSVLLATSDKKKDNKISLTFSPNPVWQSAAIQINGIDNLRGFLIGIYDILGRNVMTIPIAEGHTTFIRGGLPSGLYLYILKSGEGQPLFIGKVILD